MCHDIFEEKGLSIPVEMAIVGFNNDLFSRVTEPEITTINYPGQEMGETIGHLVIEQLNDTENLMVNRMVILDADLVIRPSSKIYL